MLKKSIPKIVSRGRDDEEVGGCFIATDAMKVETSFHQDNMLSESHAIAYMPTKSQDLHIIDPCWYEGKHRWHRVRSLGQSAWRIPDRCITVFVEKTTFKLPSLLWWHDDSPSKPNHVLASPRTKTSVHGLGRLVQHPWWRQTLGWWSPEGDKTAFKIHVLGGSHVEKIETSLCWSDYWDCMSYLGIVTARKQQPKRRHRKTILPPLTAPINPPIHPSTADDKSRKVRWPMHIEDKRDGGT